MSHDRRRVACWRFERISPLLDPTLTASERRRYMRSYAQIPVTWPSGREAPVSERSLARWLAAYLKAPHIESLMDPVRPPKAPLSILKPEWIDYALALQEEEPKRSLFVLIQSIKRRFQLSQAPARSTLHRALKANPRYLALRRRARGETRLRVRFQAKHPHQIWHADAKAPFRVHMADGTLKTFRILSLLDDATRYILAARVVLSESLAAAVATFREAAARWGLPDAFYADRGSCYDASGFRMGLAVLGVRRIGTRARNPSAHGKIESYHRTLQRWFIVELKHQRVRDEAHLQQLLDAVIDTLYHLHPHRELKTTPKQALAERRANRSVSAERLKEAFLVQRTYVPCPRTGNIRINGTLYRLPSEFRRRKKVEVLVDPEKSAAPCIVADSGRKTPLDVLLPGRANPARRSASTPPLDEPVGSLTPLLEQYRGRSLPKAHPGFGLPEIYLAFSEALGRAVPADECEANAIVEFTQDGPFDPKAFETALQAVLKQLGNGRPLRLILQTLTDRILPNKKPKGKRS